MEKNMKPQQFTLIICLVIILFSCKDLTQNDIIPENGLSVDQPWYELIVDQDVSPGIIVQSGTSIQEAIEAASPGDVIYIEPGFYRESISIDKSAIKLIGLQNTHHEAVTLESPTLSSIQLSQGVEINNIRLRNYEVSKSENETESSARKIKRKHLLNMNREDTGNGIAHYQFDIRMGEGEFDVVTLHRVVKERLPYHPVNTDGDLLMVHGASQDFDDIFYIAGAEEINEETSAPYYLAMNNIDVWGIDLAWTNVPLGTSEFGFMEGWGLEKDIDHTLKAINIARMIRGITGQSFKKMNLLGFSYGVGVAYGAASRETQLFHILKNVKGIIPVDSQLKSESSDFQNTHCADAADIWSQIQMGNFEWPQGVNFIGLGQMVVADPEGPSPAPGLNNIQFLSFIASDHSNGTHFLGGTPFELNYTDPYRFARLAAELSGPYMPYQTVYDLVSSGCPALDPSFDDHIMDIQIPIFNLSAEGGSGTLGDYTSSLTSTMDYALLNVDDPTQETELDFGHADLWMAYQAADWVWEPLRNWLYEH